LITSGQIRAARAMIRWSAADLASAAGIGSATIKRMEVMEGVPSGNVKTLLALKAALEAAGVEFVGTPDDRPGVRLVGNTKNN
jgi:transcriptional regulator with XRE-family HTH domain